MKKYDKYSLDLRKKEIKWTLWACFIIVFGIPFVLFILGVISKIIG